MSKSDEDYGGPEKRTHERRKLVRRRLERRILVRRRLEQRSIERRQERNAVLRARLDEVARNVSEHPELREGDMSQLYELIRDYDQIGPENISFNILQVVREVHADEFSPALMAMLDDVMGKDKLLQRLIAGWGALSEEQLAQIEKMLEE